MVGDTVQDAVVGREIADMIVENVAMEISVRVVAILEITIMDMGIIGVILETSTAIDAIVEVEDVATLA